MIVFINYMDRKHIKNLSVIVQISVSEDSCNDMGQVMEVRLTCYLVLLSTYGKTFV